MRTLLFICFFLLSCKEVLGTEIDFQDSDISSFQSLVDLEMSVYANERATNASGVAVCQKICKTDVTWAWPQSACTQDYETVDNMLCPSGSYSLFFCSGVQTNPVGYRYPGVCGM